MTKCQGCGRLADISVRVEGPTNTRKGTQTDSYSNVPTCFRCANVFFVTPGTVITILERFAQEDPR